ncbi:ABC transporter permease [Mesorhizobium sp. M7D.F.Ca.US.005.01.1.1]|uniref:ABC transporter permease n=1 Tax=Mesorhizobium sp. M7D.F.Ca.US.005.01.1.1 TaxID=2493678 RepID=UPI000F755F28|nr:ABC transporter permease [Mesorhizobium sp. M7D.F.Ca.US.005.01.1.1]AZO43543.1 ABC transporter permease [Mesorhizobium sp. M7D.F.Ca.US.005.01.1.1]
MATASGVAEKAERDDIRLRWLLSAPALLIVFLAALGPLLIVVVYSFLTPGNYGDVKWQFSTDAWVSVLFERDVFDDTLSFATAYLSIFWRSVSLSLATTVLTLILGFPTAYFIATRPDHRRDIWLFLITIPFWTNLLIRTFAMQEVLRNDGIINSALQALGITDHPIQLMYTNFAVLAGMVYVFLPLMVLPLYASMEKIDFRLVEAGYDLYATRFEVLKRIIVPLVTPGIVAGSILVFIPSLGAYVTPRVLGGGTNLMIGNLIELQFGAGRNWPLGAALSITLMVIVMVALLFYVRNTTRSDGAHG